jgi:tetratricopeptide (TPR) repeat protein
MKPAIYQSLGGLVQALHKDAHAERWAGALASAWTPAPLPRRLATSLVAATLLALTLLSARAEVKAYRGQIELPTYPWWPAVKHPYFRGTDGRNIYPYPMLDNLSRTKEPRTWRTVVLENEYLRVTFLPELGGRVYEVLDKTTGQPMFYVNHVVKPGLIGQCGAWISGGIEFNTGPAGHTVSAIQPVDVLILPPAADGSRSVAVGETERIYRTKWTVVITLRPGRSFLEETIRIYNPTETVRPYYFWNCTAVPNPPGFRFVYPMTLGTDHGGTTFYTWPIANGKDLSRGTNYQDASSIFAYGCDQDFFGSYDDGADRGVVAYANHHQLPGKKAWTWGHGSYGTMHQMDLTDTDGPYNEVQTGPLLTQADVGRLDPCEAVSWQEWWYPVHGLGGFTYANKDVAVNATLEGQKLRVRLLGTGSWKSVLVEAHKVGDKWGTAKAICVLSPAKPADVGLDLREAAEPTEVQISTRDDHTLASFRLPLDLPVRKPPEKRPAPQTATELAQAGWQDYLFARYPEAETQFRKALEKDPKSVAAHTGLAYLNLDRAPETSASEAGAALATDPDCGQARFALAVAQYRLGNAKAALDEAWKAALDPATAVAGRALVAKLLLRQWDWEGTAKALSEPGPWQTDPTCRNRLAYALAELGDHKGAARLTQENLRDDPLDAFALSVQRTPGSPLRPEDLAYLLAGKAGPILDLAIEYAEIGQYHAAQSILSSFCDGPPVKKPTDPIPYYWMAYLASKTPSPRPFTQNSIEKWLGRVGGPPVDEVFPHHFETVPILRWALERNPNDGKAAVYLGHLLFSLGRHAEGREMWAKAAQLGAAPSVAWRALGMASLNLDHDAEAAAKFLGQAHAADPADAIVARDLAQVLFTLADKADSPEQKQGLVTRARDALKAAFAGGKGRADFVALLARAYSRLGEHAETARLLDSVRITIWEGAREAHDLFEQAHLALGTAHLDAGRAAEALAEFNRALEYPENLATGKLEQTREAHIHYLRGRAFAALGQKQAALEAWQKAANEPASQDSTKEEARKKAKEALEEAK